MTTNHRDSRRTFLGAAAGLGLASASTLATAGTETKPPLIRVENTKKIYTSPAGETLRYNSFTNLEFWRGNYYVVFRQAQRHTPSRCKLILLCSANLEHWKQVLVLDRPKFDDRDPKLLVTPKRLILYSVPYPRDTEVVASEDGIKWTPIKDAYAGSPRDQFWKPKFHDGWYYVACDYNNDTVELLRSKDGLDWSRAATVISKTKYKPTETAIVFLKDGRCLAMMRLNGLGGSTLPGYAIAKPPYTKWQFTLGKSVRFSGQAVERYGDTIVVASRAELGKKPGQWDFPRGSIRKDRGHRTVLSTFDVESMRLKVHAVLPTERGYDNSYCGLLRTGKDRALVSWHDGDVKTFSNIWLAHIRIN